MQKIGLMIKYCCAVGESCINMAVRLAGLDL